MRSISFYYIIMDQKRFLNRSQRLTVVKPCKAAWTFFGLFFFILKNNWKLHFIFRHPSQKFKPNPKWNILALVRFEFLGNQEFTRRCRGEVPNRISEQNLVRLVQVVGSIWKTNISWSFWNLAWSSPDNAEPPLKGNNFICFSVTPKKLLKRFFFIFALVST